MGARVLAQRWLATPQRCEACAGLCWVMTWNGPDACLLCYRRSVDLTNSSTPRVCEREGCAVKYIPVSFNQRFCRDHAYTAQSIQQAFADRHCVVCRQMYRPHRREQTACSDKCRREARTAHDLEQRKQTYGTRECGCGVTFVPLNRTNVRCRACAAVLKAPPVVKAPKPAVPCLGCKHGKAQPQAELGVECVAGMWTRCKPLLAAVMFEAAQDGEEGAS